MEYRITVTVSEHGYEPENGERVLDGFLRTHPQTGPVVDQDVAAGTLSITFAVDASDYDHAVDSAREVFAGGMKAAGASVTQVLHGEADLIPAEEIEPELQPV